MNLHVGTEPATGHLGMLGTGLSHQIVVQLFPEPRRRRAGEARAQAAAGVGGQGELRDQQQTAADIAHRAVHPALGVGEHPVAQQLVQKLVGTGAVILALDPDQHQQAVVDGPDDLAGHLHPRMSHSLDQRLHQASSGGSSSRRCAISLAARTSASQVPGSVAE